MPHHVPLHPFPSSLTIPLIIPTPYAPIIIPPGTPSIGSAHNLFSLEPPEGACELRAGTPLLYPPPALCTPTPGKGSPVPSSPLPLPLPLAHSTPTSTRPLPPTGAHSPDVVQT